MVNGFKGCTTQSDELVDTKIYSKEHVDVRNWLRNDYAEQVDAISYSKKFVMDGSNPKSNPSVATHTINGNLILTLPTEFQHKKYYSTQPSKLSSNRLPCSSPPKWRLRKRFLASARQFSRRRTSQTRRALAREFSRLLGR